MTEDRAATVKDVQLSAEQLRSEMAAMRVELRTEMSEMKTELRSEIADLRVDLVEQIATSKTEVLVRFEALKSDFRVIAESVIRLDEKVTKGFADLPRLISENVAMLELAARSHSTQLKNHEGGIEILEDRQRRGARRSR